MIRIIDTHAQIESLFTQGEFNWEAWESYIDSIYENSAAIFKDDLKECLDSGGYIYEKDVLPIINAVHGHPALETLHTSFKTVTNGLSERIATCFGKDVDVDIVLYLGLCNAAGWVTNINERDVILLGIEKILELNWCGEDDMYGLIYHELGHIYQKQHGVFEQSSDDNSRNFVWQLFTEGIAMYFEQMLVNDPHYYHQNKNGWVDWCEEHFRQILTDFHAALPTMTRSNQTYFGDWVSYYGLGDVGYYLGTKFVHYLREKYDFEQLIQKKIDDIYQEYMAFADIMM